MINLDNGCVYSNMNGFGTLTAIELNTRSLYFAWVNLSAIFAIRESRINDIEYEEAQWNAATGYIGVIEDSVNSQSEVA